MSVEEQVEVKNLSSQQQLQRKQPIIEASISTKLHQLLLDAAVDELVTAERNNQPSGAIGAICHRSSRNAKTGSV